MLELFECICSKVEGQTLGGATNVLNVSSVPTAENKPTFFYIHDTIKGIIHHSVAVTAWKYFSPVILACSFYLLLLAEYSS